VGLANGLGGRVRGRGIRHGIGQRDEVAVFGVAHASILDIENTDVKQTLGLHQTPTVGRHPMAPVDMREFYDRHQI
jgi:hypothetical protein